jgi:hypothetical protein
MKRKIRTAGFWLVLVTACLCTAQVLQAQSASGLASGQDASKYPGLTALNAGCGFSTEGAPAEPVPPKHRPGQSNGESRKPSLVLISAHNDQNSGPEAPQAGIVGFWHVKFLAQATNPPSGILPTLPFAVDAGYSQWHSDGTEINNSAGRAPSTGNFCLGVWKQTGPRTYVLNHFGAAFDASTPATLIGPANIREAVTLSADGDSFIGTFSIDQYNESGADLAQILGTISATRITVTTGESSIF